jgi:hypothetical protein
VPDEILPAEALEPDEGWLCGCGTWMDHSFHCDGCGAEPPWGCPCDVCSEPPDEDDWDEGDCYGP